MKVCIIQPPYSGDYEQSQACFEKMLELMDQCDDTMDVIVLPESCDVPSLAKTKEQSEASTEKYNEIMVQKARELAKRCHAVVFFNARSFCKTGTRNTTYAIDRQGEVAGKYYKQHLTPGEVSKLKLDSDYSFEHEEPAIVEIEGVRYAFLVCYDFYFYENFPQLARYQPDVIIGCSHQRSDSHDALEILGRFLCYNTNAWLFRSSVSMDENSDIGGGSMIVSPEGKVLVNMKSEVGIVSFSGSSEAVMKKLFRDYQLEFVPLMEKDTYAYVWKDHPLAGLKEISIEDLRAYPCVSFDQSNDGNFYLTEEAMADYPFDKMIRSDDRATSMEIIAELSGYSIGSGMLSEEEAVLQGLVAIKLEEEDPLTIGYITRKGSALSKYGKAYVEELLKYI